MLLSFEVENYKSFMDKVTFSMIPAAKQKGLDYSVMHKNISKKEYKALSSSVVYGANAAGKTNIIGAMQTFKNIILRGNIRNCQQTSPNVADCALELIPNNTLRSAKPVSFSIYFICSDLNINYSIELDLGMFLDKTYSRSILLEKLIVNEKLVFERKNNKLSFNNLSVIESYLIQNFSKNKKAALAIAENSLNKEDLFLSNGFKNIISTKLATQITEYFANKFITIYHSEFLHLTPTIDVSFVEDKLLNDAAKAFGINSNKLVYIKNKENNESVLCSVMENNRIIPAELFESYGTIRFTNIFPLLLEAIRDGKTLIIDEFDASIHPMAIMNIIEIFHNDEINIHNAQLIFNTHNPLYLNGNILRRDEIKFVERDEQSSYSKLYCLSDFGTKGTKARKGKDYMNNYFVNEYGAIRDIDLSPVFEKIVTE